MSASDLPRPDQVIYTREWCDDLNFWNEASLRAYGDKRAREALQQAHDAMHDIPGCKATRFDAQTAIRKLMGAAAPTPGEKT